MVARRKKPPAVEQEQPKKRRTRLSMAALCALTLPRFASLRPIQVLVRSRRRESEAGFQNAILSLAKRYNWLYFHEYDSRQSEAGFPDLVLLHPLWNRLLWRELKVQGGEISIEQQVWLESLVAGGQDAKIWTPDDWQEIKATLTTHP